MNEKGMEENDIALFHFKIDAIAFNSIVILYSKVGLIYHPNQDTHARKRVPCEFSAKYSNCRYLYYCLRELPKQPLFCLRGQMENRQDLGGRDALSLSPFPVAY